MLEHRAAFDDIVYSVCETLAMVRDESTRDTYLIECEEVLRFNRARAVQFAPDGSPIRKFQEYFSRDILAWRLGGYSGSPSPGEGGAGTCHYEFYLSPEKTNYLQGLLSQFNFRNLNMTLRKMSEYAAPDKLFYDVRHARN